MMNPVVQEWIDYAKRDIQAAERLSDDKNLSAIACFHSQQSVEKSLKAIVEFKSQIPPKIHDLIRLYEIIDNAIKIEEDMLARLNELYIDSRYPPGLLMVFRQLKIQKNL